MAVEIKRIVYVALLAALTWQISVDADTKKDKQVVVSASESRLVLAPNAQLHVPFQPIWEDSVEAIVTVAVTESCKNQRHLCRIEANHAVRLSTTPLMKWALRHDTLMVISAVPLQIRAARKQVTDAASAQSLALLRIHYQHLHDHTIPSGTAIVELATAGSTSIAKPAVADSASASSLAAGTSAATSTKTGTSVISIMFVAIIGLFVVLIATQKWLDRRSQRRLNQKLQRIERKPPNKAPLQPAIAPAYRPRPPAEIDGDLDSPPEKEEAAAPIALEENISPSTATPALTPSVPSVPAYAPANGSGVTLETILEQLQEVKADLQQIAASQHEVKDRLTEITPLTKANAPEGFIRLALFDIIDEAPADNRRDRSTSAEAPSRLRLRFAEESRKQGVAVDLALPIPLHINVGQSNGAPKNFSVKLAAPSKLRILFAGNEENDEIRQDETPAATGDSPSEAERLPAGHMPEVAVE
jgi:hypothetical protein